MMSIRTLRAGLIRRIRGFTLIELLVVVAIITLLMSILTPSLTRARQQAKSAVCLSNLSQLVKCITLYTSDNHYELPPMRYRIGPPEVELWHGWAECLYTYNYEDKDYSFAENYPVQRNQNNAFPLWVCKDAQPMQGSTGHYRVFDVSWSCGSLERIKARLPIITDANPVVTDPNDVLRSDIPREHVAGLEGEAYIDERHYGGANYVFNDGHAVRDTALREKLAEDWDLDPNTPNR